MDTKWKVVIVTVIAAIVGFVFESNGPVGSQIWPAHDMGSAPEGGVLGGFIAYGIIEAIVFGLGVAFLVFALPALKRAVPGQEGVAMGAYLGIGWLLVNWVPHTALHMNNAPDGWGRLLFIEYAFHVTLMIAGLLLARFFLAVLSDRTAARTVSAAKAGAVTLVMKGK